mgnify:CR=1 FL=1
MNICLIGDGLISLTLAKALINNKVNVYMYCKSYKKQPNYNRTIGISKTNLDFFQKEIIKIKKKFLWEINKIEIFNDENNDEKILNFDKKNNFLFSIIKNNDLYNLLLNDLKRKKNFYKNIIKNKFFYKNIIKNKKYDLIINCDSNNEISKRFFNQKFLKNYESTAYAAIINHDWIKNKNASQIFTKFGPIAFLPLSNFQTSIVYSIKNKSVNKSFELSNLEFQKIIFDNNKKYKIKNVSKFESFTLKSKILRNYYNKNILAFGDMLHQIHPLSGQGFNMTLRDIKIFSSLIDSKLDLGLPLDSSILKEFENNTKHLNYIFSSGINFIHEFFRIDNNFENKLSKKFIKKLGKNNFFNKMTTRFADQGIIF